MTDFAIRGVAELRRHVKYRHLKYRNVAKIPHCIHYAAAIALSEVGCSPRKRQGRMSAAAAASAAQAAAAVCDDSLIPRVTGTSKMQMFSGHRLELLLRQLSIGR